MKWDVKHDKAKEIINGAFAEAELWFTDKEKIAGLTEEEVGEVNKELTTMMDSIRKRYKLDVRLESTEGEAVQPQATAETVEAEEVTPAEEKPKRGRRKAADGEEKPKRSRKKKETAE